MLFRRPDCHNINLVPIALGRRVVDAVFARILFGFEFWKAIKQVVPAQAFVLFMKPQTCGPQQLSLYLFC